MNHSIQLVKPQIVPSLDENFRPAVLWNRAFREAVRSSGRGVPLRLALERGDGSVSVFETEVFAPEAEPAGANQYYVERLVKFLLWQRGGWKVTVGGPQGVGEYIQATYAPGGARAFDARFMGEQVYEKPFTVEITDAEGVPEARETGLALGRHLDGARVGFDLGGSDRKVSAVIDGEAIFSEEVVWDPKNQSDWTYHREGLLDSLGRAAEALRRRGRAVEAIGGSAAGVYIHNRVMVASLFRKVPRDVFNAHVKDLFLNVGQEWGVPLVVVNDGEVTALAGAMALEAEGQDGTRVLGIAMGTDEAGGYVNPEGNITGWLNELAFAPVDYSPAAPVNEWEGSTDRGCGGEYFSQKAVIRLAPAAGIVLDEALPPAEKLLVVQNLLGAGDERAKSIFETIGCYLGYAIAHYADFYDLRHVLILGRVTSGEGGRLIKEKAEQVLRQEFPTLFEQLTLHLPEEEAKRRVGQSIAAASLPVIER